MNWAELEARVARQDHVIDAMSRYQDYLENELLEIHAHLGIQTSNGKAPIPNPIPEVPCRASVVYLAAVRGEGVKA